MRVLSTMSFPGPKAMHSCVRLLHEELTKSHGSPVSIHLAPIVLGETSPRLELAKAATNGPCYRRTITIKFYWSFSRSFFFNQLSR